jgi:DNA-binding transcriptional LysR family regulator
MNPHHLELFYHVAKSRGVSRAVRQMPYGIQQPSVSAQVNALERDLGVTLYERRPFRLTPAGEELFKFVQPFFDRIGEVRERVQGGAQIRFGASPILFREYLSPVIRALRQKFPSLNMILRALNQPDLVDAIEHDELDLVISLIPDKLSPGLHSIPIVELPLALLAPKSLGLKAAKDLWASKKVKQPLISLGPRELICQKFQGRLAELGVSWLPKLEMDSLDLIEQYAEGGYGIGLSVRMPSKKFSTKLRVLDLPDFPSVHLGIIHRNSTNTEAHIRQAFLQEITSRAAAFAHAKP